MLTIEVSNKGLTFIIINLYAPQGFGIYPFKSFFNSLPIPVFIFGDFNLHHPLWEENRASPMSNNFAEWIQNSSFILVNTTVPSFINYNGTNSLLGLTIMSTSIYHQIDCSVADSTFESDHNPVITTWSVLNNNPKNIKIINCNRVM
ncbi:hypothetical protein AVEN_249747-1 [Araneus ventricosus]|uniref:Endonuclease/exonuclease/phosphatase domain-containing protein n=1 Tax=Araneus ventricosus TaxID=182803 RepID=A0A4Y2C7R4_ARAVE|nr:hypothetical protein AVEN_249747-1 [Araneus ventricosus]